MPSRRQNNVRTTAYDHPNRKRAVIPSAQDPLVDERVKQARMYAPGVRTPDDEPRLAWVRGDSDTNTDTPPRKHVSLPLYVREEINPAEFVAALTGARSQAELEGMVYTYEDLPEGAEARYQWYEHRQNWRNRVIHGESEAVMASLLDRESMAGKVQMIFFDPPFGIKYNSNFQPDQHNSENRDDGRPAGRPQGDVRTLKAFRDTWENGVHSYLDSIIDKLRLFRELLTESGSLFFQIGDENMARCLLLCDEIFGAENRVSLIPFATSGATSSSTLSNVILWLIWYAKDKIHLKYQQLYERLSRAEIIEHFSSYAFVELADGTPAKLKDAERLDPNKNLSKGSRLFRTTRLVSQGHSDTGRSEPYHWREKSLSIDCPEGSHWRVSHEGLDQLAKKNRLHQSSQDTELGWKWYEDEVPGKRINNMWSKQSSVSDKRYVVQTDDKIIERCILMSTDPGDLVLDPTCGGGTTAAVAEEWGRRWITIDVSAVAISHVRQRVATGLYPYYTIAGTQEGINADAKMWRKAGDDARADKVASTDPWITGPAARNPEHGFVYERVPYVSAAVLAYDLEPPPIMLVDRPHKTTRRNKQKLRRVASPFTVESHTAFSYAGFAEGHEGISPEQLQPLADRDGDYAQRITAQLLASPVDSGSSSHPTLQVRSVEEWPGEHYVTHRVTYSTEDDPIERNAALVILPEDAPATADTLRAAATEAGREIYGIDLVIVVANEFDPNSATQERFGKVQVVRVVPHRDLAIIGLKEDQAHDAFVALGQPDIAWWDEPDGHIALEVQGWDSYNPKTGQVDEGGTGDISAMLVDTNYNGRDFVARLMHFPGAGNDKLVKRLHREMQSTLDPERWEAMLTTATAPFPAPETGKVAVKIVTTRGLEMTTALEVTQGPERPKPPPPEPTEPTPADPLVADRQRLCERIGRLAETLTDQGLDWAATSAEALRQAAATTQTPDQLTAIQALVDQLETTAQLLTDAS